MKCKVISQKMLSTECWSWGTGACEDCDYRGTKECGGKKILNTGRNVLAHRIPLPDVSYKYREAL
jgi:hypothetical protein